MPQWGEGTRMNRILFVDDEPHVLAALRRVFCLRDMAACAVYFAESGAKALKAMAARPFDAVVSDFRMPGIDGTQFLCEVRRRYPDTVRLVLSGCAEERGLIQLADLAHQFIPKGCDPGVLLAALDLPLRLGPQLKDQRMRAEVSGAGTLPSSRAAVRDLLAVLDSSCGVGTVAEVLQRDVALAAKVLQLVNSAFFAARARITSLEDAIVRLGLPTIRSVVVESGARRRPDPFDPAGPSPRDPIEVVNLRALTTARLARRLAPPEQADDAFSAGLLHECGKLAMAATRPDALAPRCRHHRKASRRSGTEARAMARAGAYLLSLWGLPPEVVEAVACHAGPVDVRANEPPDLVTAVQIAHLVATSETVCDCGRPAHPVADVALLQATGTLEAVRRWKAEQVMSPA